jgi:hypothetical protein
MSMIFFRNSGAGNYRLLGIFTDADLPIIHRQLFKILGFTMGIVIFSDAGR